MPILEFHLVEKLHSDEKVAELLTASSQLYAGVLKSPIERVRVFAHMHSAKHVAVAGKLVVDSQVDAPYFHFLVLEGRPLEECHQLLEGFSNLVVNILGADRADVRGGCWPIPPQYWAIGGMPASKLRLHEIQARQSSATLGGAVGTM